MPQRVLIWNRGACAERIYETLNKLGIEAVFVVEEGDQTSLHAQHADCKTVTIRRYTEIEELKRVALETGVDAVAFGWGFFAESPEASHMLRDLGIVAISPSVSALQKTGDKAAAKKIAKDLGIPVIEGPDEDIQTVDQLRKAAEFYGWGSNPVLLKLAAGGGGFGQRVVRLSELTDPELDVIIRNLRSSGKSFGDSNGRLLAELYLERVRHVEVQIAADTEWNVVCVGTRECSLQSGGAKVVEVGSAESAFPGLTPETLATLKEQALNIVRALGYNTIGTVEFLVNEEGEGHFFLEINPRLQVEHRVTEDTTIVDIPNGVTPTVVDGKLDLVALQISLAMGNPLPFGADQIRTSGTCIEVRINHIPDNGGRGIITELHIPKVDGVGVIHGAKAGTMPQGDLYAPTIFQVLALGEDITEAAERMSVFLRHLRIGGIHTNVSRLLTLLPRVSSGKYNTDTIPESLKGGGEPFPIVNGAWAGDPSETRQEDKPLCVTSAVGGAYHRTQPSPWRELARPKGRSFVTLP